MGNYFFNEITEYYPIKKTKFDDLPNDLKHECFLFLGWIEYYDLCILYNVKINIKCYPKVTIDDICNKEQEHFDIVKYLYEHGYQCTKFATEYACKHGHINILEYFEDIGKLDREAMYFACKYGNLDVIRWLYDSGDARYDNEGIDWLCSKGKLKCLKYIYSVDRDAGEYMKYNSSPIIYACYNGRDEVVKFLFSIGIKIDDITMSTLRSCEYHQWLVEYIESMRNNGSDSE